MHVIRSILRPQRVSYVIGISRLVQILDRCTGALGKVLRALGLSSQVSRPVCTSLLVIGAGVMLLTTTPVIAVS